jgi:uncharacterized protein
MKIRLKEIPQDGRDYTFDRKSGELNDALSDLIGDHGYNVSLFIKPIGSAYEMRGQIKTTVHETCSHCGYDFELPLSRAVKEVLFEEQEAYRKTHSVQGSQMIDFSQDELSMTPIRGDILDAGEFVHEMIALSEPLYPVCGPDGQCLNAAEVEAIRRRLEEEAELAVETKKPNPFNALSGLDLKKKN